MHPVATRRRKLALVMVGLPARGKTYTARKLARYLRWSGYNTRVFNVGNYRRKHIGAQLPHSFFDPDNPEGLDARRRMAETAMGDLLTWFREEGDVGIYDATNSTRARRRWVHEQLTRAGMEVVFIETLCNDREIIESNIRETKLRSPDYAAATPEEAVQDFRARIAHYERAYEPLDEVGYSYIQIVDVGRRVVMNRIHGYLPGRLVFFLMNLHITPRPILLTRHGQSTYNLEDRIGGDASLSDAGRGYAQALASFVDRHHPKTRPLEIWTSTLQRAVQTAAPLHRPFHRWRALDEIGSGACDGLTYAEFRARFPEEYAARKDDKLRYRYPRGESYQDVMLRIEPVLIELERQRDPVLVIAHQAVLRAMYTYFTNRTPEDCPHLEIPLHTVIELTPKAYGADEHRYALGPRVDDSSSS